MSTHQELIQKAKDAIDAVASDNTVPHDQRLVELQELKRWAQYEMDRICPEQT